MQGRAGPFVVAPLKRVIDHNRFRHAPRVVAKIAREIFLLPAHDVAEHFVGPIHLARDRLRIRIDQQLRAVETHAALGIVRPINAVAVELSRTHIGQEHMPDLVRVFRHRDANIFLGRVDIIEEAEIDRGRHFGKNREVNSVAEPGRSERIGIAQPNLYRRHKMESFLSATRLGLATN